MCPNNAEWEECAQTDIGGHTYKVRHMQPGYSFLEHPPTTEASGATVDNQDISGHPNLAKNITLRTIVG